MSEEIVKYESPDQQAMLAEASAAFDLTTTFEIGSQDTYSLAADQVREAKQAISLLTERRLGITRKFDDLKKDVMGLFTPALTKWNAVKEYYERGMLVYVEHQELLRKQEQERLEAIARAERERLEAEARALEAKAARTKNVAKQDELLEQASAAQLTAEIITPARASTVAPTATGTGVRGTWKGRCTNKMELLKFIVANPAYLSLVDVNDSALHSTARAQKENMDVGGCESYLDKSITTRK